MRNNNLWKIPVGLCLALILSCSKSTDEIAARVNGEEILVSDLEFSLNFFPQFAPSKRGYDAVKAHLDLLIEKQLFAQEGRRRGYGESENVIRVANWVERQELLKEIYSREIRDKVTVTREEIEKRFLQGLDSYHVRHIFVPTEDDAHKIKSLLERGASFEEIAAQTFQDSILRKNGGDLGFLTLDKMAPEFAEVVPNLATGVVSEPVRTRWGYHLIRVDDHRKMVFADEATLESKSVQLGRIIRLEKEKQRGSEFVGDYMEQFDIQLINSSFNTLANELKKIVIAATEQVPNYQPALGGKEIELMDHGLEQYSDLPLVTYKGGAWTIGDFMTKVRNLPINERPKLDSPAKFRRDIGKLVRDEFMIEEARKRGYDKLDRIRREVKRWRDDFTFSEYWNDVRDTITVSEQEVGDYFSLHRGRYILPERVHVLEILLATEKEALDVLSRYRGGADFAELARKYSLRKWAAEKGGDLGWIERGQYGNASTKAFEMSDGEVGGPFPVREGFVLIKRLGFAAARPATLSEAREAVFEDARNEKQRSMYADLKSQLLKKADIRVNVAAIERLGREYANVGNIYMPGLRSESAQ